MNYLPGDKQPTDNEKTALEPDWRALFDLEELSEFFDPDDTAKTNSVNEKQMPAAGEKYVVFDLGEKTYAIHSRQVSEVFGSPPLARLPFAPVWLAGIASLHGEITPVVDLRSLWSIPAEAPARAKAIVLRSAKSDARAAFLVDKLNEIVTLSPHDINFSAADFEASFPVVFGRAVSGGRSLFLLDAEKLLALLVFNDSVAL